VSRVDVLAVVVGAVLGVTLGLAAARETYRMLDALTVEVTP
jgi:hypothetical protein